jgi:ABC-type Fe3+ transport system permease subunit
VTILSSLLAGVLSLSDPGGPLILGCRAAAVEIRTTFAALYDYELAGRQCLALAAIVFLVTAPLVVVGLRRLTAAILARQTRPARPYGHRAVGSLGFAGLFMSLSIGVVVPALGLCLPAVENPMWTRAWEKVVATAFPTLWFTCGAGFVAVLLGTALALAARTRRRLQALVLGAFVLLLALPPSLSAMGVAMLAASAPPQFDWLLRSSLTVPLVLGLRLLPLVAVGMIRAVESLSSSWYEAARLHGVRPWRFGSRVIVPLILPAMVIAFLVTAVLSASDITTTHLLQPPGRQSLPVAIFTVMANSPEGLVASLCLLYLSVVTVTLLLASFIPRWTTARNP